MFEPNSKKDGNEVIVQNINEETEVDKNEKDKISISDGSSSSSE